MKQSWKVILAFSGIFLAGAITGGTVSFLWKHDKRPGPPPQGPRLSIEQFLRNQQDQMTKKLHLTEEQVSRISPILNQASQDLRALHEGNFRETEKVMQRQDSDILKVLTPEQQKKFEQFRKEQRDRLEQNRKDRAERVRKQPAPSGAQHQKRGNEDMPPPPEAGGPEGPPPPPTPGPGEQEPKP